MYECPRHGSWTPEPNALSADERACPVCKEEYKKAQAVYSANFRIWKHWDEKSGIPPIYRSASLSRFMLESETRKVAHGLAVEYSEMLRSQSEERISRGYWLWGPTGVGKTQLLCAQVTAACEAGLKSHYLSWPHWAEPAKAAFRRRDDSYVNSDNVFSACMESELLALDEACMIRATDWERRMLMRLVDSRYARGLPTIYAASRIPEKVPGIPPPALSRIRGRTLEIELSGDDIRPIIEKLPKEGPAIDKPTPPDIKITPAGLYETKDLATTNFRGHVVN